MDWLEATIDRGKRDNRMQDADLASYFGGTYGSGPPPAAAAPYLAARELLKDKYKGESGLQEQRTAGELARQNLVNAGQYNVQELSGKGDLSRQSLMNQGRLFLNMDFCETGCRAGGSSAPGKDWPSFVLPRRDTA